VVDEVELDSGGSGLLEHLPERQGVRDEAVGVRAAGSDDEDLVALCLQLGPACLDGPAQDELGQPGLAPADRAGSGEVLALHEQVAGIWRWPVIQAGIAAARSA